MELVGGNIGKVGDILLRAVVFSGRVAVAIVVVRVDEVANLAVFVGLGLSVFGGGVVLIVFWWWYCCCSRWY